MGRDKALLQCAGHSFLETIIERLLAAGIAQIAVVLGHHADQIRAAVDLGDARVVLNPEYRSGQTSSLQAGLRALAPDEPPAVLLCLVDHPAVSAGTMRLLCEAFHDREAAIVIPSFNGRRGHPVVIGHQLFREILTLDPGHGANEVIRRYNEQTAAIEVSDPGILADIDHPADYAALQCGA